MSAGGTEVGWFTGIFTYVMIWWVALFAVLPWGATSAHEAGEKAEQGHAESAPLKPRIGRKLLATSVVAAVLWAIWYVLLTRGLLPF